MKTPEEKIRLLKYLSMRDSSSGGTLVSPPSDNDIRLTRIINLAAMQTEVNPTQSQKESGNYKKGRFSLNGLQFVIENPKGTIRSGESKYGLWSVRMPVHYGYISRTSGADEDQIDVYIGNRPSSGLIYVFDQVIDGEFDEHKVMLGFDSLDEAKRAYQESFSGTAPYGGSAEMGWTEFKQWLDTGDSISPVTEQAVEKFNRTVQLIKSHEADGEIFLYGAVMIPEKEDRSQFRDIMDEDTIRRSARRYLTNYRHTGYRHKAILRKEAAEITQSFITPMDMVIGKNRIPKGSWVIECCIRSVELKKQVADGEIAAFSYGGDSVRWRIEKVSGSKVEATRWMGPKGDGISA